MKVNVILAKCHIHNDIFGIRVEDINSDWICTWAFKVTGKQAKDEGMSDNATLSGSFKQTASYPGCPYCGCKNFVLCSCGKISCWNGKDKSLKCHWCNCQMNNIITVESLNISSSKPF